MTKQEVWAKLCAAGFKIRSEGRVPSNDRWRLVLDNGAIVDCLDDGSWSVWARGQEEVANALGFQEKRAAPIASSPILADRVKVVIDPTVGNIRLELSGRQKSDALPVSVSFLMNEDFARQLLTDLATAAYQLRLLAPPKMPKRHDPPRPSVP